MKYIDLMINKLAETVASPEKGRVDIKKWYNRKTAKSLKNFMSTFHLIRLSNNV